MKQHLAAVLTVLAVAAGVGWKISARPESSAPLEDIRLDPSSEHAHPGHTEAMARIRLRLSPSDLGVESSGAEVPRIATTAERT
jgi:hypothetical protein